MWIYVVSKDSICFGCRNVCRHNFRFTIKMYEIVSKLPLEAALEVAKLLVL
ncbi:MAG: hypothetical protein ACTS6H_02835 [Candidatus Hodgkinia cicadicola]